MTVTIIDSAGNTVATLVRDYPVPRYKDALAALERPPRHRAARYGHIVTPDGRSILVPAHTKAGSRRRANTASRVSLQRPAASTVLSPRSFTLVRP